MLTVLPSKNKAITYLLTYLYTKNIRNNVVFSYKTSNIETDVKTSIFTRCDILVRHSQTQTVLSIFVAGSSMYNKKKSLEKIYFQIIIVFWIGVFFICLFTFKNGHNILFVSRKCEKRSFVTFWLDIGKMSILAYF